MTIVCSVQKAASKNPDPSYARNRCVYAPSTSSQSRFSGNLLDLGFRSTPDSTEMLAATKSEQLIDGNHRAHLGFSAKFRTCTIWIENQQIACPLSQIAANAVCEVCWDVSTQSTQSKCARDLASHNAWCSGRAKRPSRLLSLQKIVR